MTLPLLPGETAMPSLERVQRRICAAIVGGADLELLSIIDPDGIASAARLQIYRNHAFLTLSEALKAIYPVVCRLVDERFFSYAAHEYLRDTLPATPCLVEYGASFADFLAAFPACRGVPYLADVARLEWAVNGALNAEAASALAVDRLRAVAPDDAPGLRLTLHPSHRLLVSPWPVDRIWSANQPDAGPDAEVDLDAGGARLEVFRRGDRVAIAALSPASHAFRAAVAAGARLDAAVEAALAHDPLFDLPLTLRGLFDLGLITGCSPAGPGKEEECHVRPRQ